MKVNPYTMSRESQSEAESGEGGDTLDEVVAVTVNFFLSFSCSTPSPHLSTPLHISPHRSRHPHTFVTMPPSRLTCPSPVLATNQRKIVLAVRFFLFSFSLRLCSTLTIPHTPPPWKSFQGISLHGRHNLPLIRGSQWNLFLLKT